MSADLAGGMEMLRQAAARGLLVATLRLKRAAQQRRKADSYAAIVLNFEPKHPIAQRAALLATAASFRATAWEALAHLEGEAALLARRQANAHQARAKQDRRP